jgi:hypothetical protein
MLLVLVEKAPKLLKGLKKFNILRLCFGLTSSIHHFLVQSLGKKCAKEVNSRHFRHFEKEIQFDALGTVVNGFAASR